MEAHQRLTWPLLALSLPLFALAVLFSSEFNRRGQWRRILVAALGMAGLVIVYFICRSMGLKYPPMAAALYVLTVGVGVTSWWLLASGRTVAWRRKLLLAPPVGAV